MEQKKKPDVHTVSVLVTNKPGVLVRCAQVFARRGFNIDSLVVSASVNQKYSRMTITAQGDPGTLDQIIKQTSKLVDVIHCAEHTGVDAITKEFVLVKVKVTSSIKAAILKLIKKYHTKVSYEDKNVLIIEQTGTTEQLDELEGLLKKYDIVEMVRSGKLVMALGKGPT